MTRILLRRAALSLVTACGVVMLVSALLAAIPGDPVDALLGERASAADREALRSSLGLDRPATERTLRYAAGVLRGDLGSSLLSGRPVADLLRERWPATAALALAATALAVAIALPLGLLAAARPGGLADRLSLGLATFSASLPSFALGPLLVLAFAVWLPWLPVAGRSGAASLVLPATTLALGMAAVLARQLRAAMIDALATDALRAARARGVPTTRLFLVHALRLAATPAVTVLALQAAGLLAGAVVTETVFAWPGLGRLLVQAIGARDLPVVQGCALAIALTFVAANLLADVAAILLDPRTAAAQGDAS
ncbi:MAG: ABC transporter permease [Alphaproteobacteria bacterium]